MGIETIRYYLLNCDSSGEHRSKFCRGSDDVSGANSVQEVRHRADQLGWKVYRGAWCCPECSKLNLAATAREQKEPA